MLCDKQRVTGSKFIQNIKKGFFMEIIVGIVGCIVGAGVLIMHIFAPHKLGKLEAFQKTYGQTAGKIMHIVFYAVFNENMIYIF
jgi:uncharacterized membrane protein YeaQ/YmgE (transglycosylase-associated protein family)